GVVDRGSELTGRLVAAVGRHVRPEDRVVHVTGQVEGEVLRQHVDGVEAVLVAGLRQLLQCRVGPGDVGVVVLGVVQLHDLAGDVRGECTVVVGKVGKCVVSHSKAPHSSTTTGFEPVLPAT